MYWSWSSAHCKGFFNVPFGYWLPRSFLVWKLGSLSVILRMVWCHPFFMVWRIGISSCSQFDLRPPYPSVSKFRKYMFLLKISIRNLSCSPTLQACGDILLLLGHSHTQISGADSLSCSVQLKLLHIEHSHKLLQKSPTAPNKLDFSCNFVYLFILTNWTCTEFFRILDSPYFDAAVFLFYCKAVMLLLKTFLYSYILYLDV